MTITVEDVPYLTLGGKALLARLYRPQGAGEGARPAIVSVHGGAWTFGDRTSNAGLDTALAEAGFLVMAVDFRMPPEAIYPGSIADINAAIRWLRREAGRLGVDPARIGGLGTSSGGHQIMLAALRPDFPAYRAHPGEGEAHLAWVLIGWGVMDPLARYRLAQEKGMAQALAAHHAWWPDEAAMADGNPQLILERGEPGPRPPVLIAQGEADTNLPPDVAHRFAAAYRAAGGEIALRHYVGEGHLFATQNPDSPAAREAVAAMIAFSRQHAMPTP